MTARKKWLKYAVAAAVAAAIVTGLTTRGWPNAAAPPGGDFNALQLNGRPWTFRARYLGGPVLLSFVNPHCKICRAEIPRLERLQKQYRNRGLQVVLVIREPSTAIREDPLFKHAPVKILTAAPHVFCLYKVPATPYLVAFDSRGNRDMGLDARLGSALAIAEKRLLR